MKMSKTLALLITNDKKVMLFPGWYENMKESIDKEYTEVSNDLLLESNWLQDSVFFAELENVPYKTFKLKSKKLIKNG